MARAGMRVSISLVVLVALSSACQGGHGDEVEGETNESSSEDESSSESTSGETESETESETETSESETGTEGGEPLWAIVEAYELYSEINQIWAVDLSDPAIVGETEILVVDSNYGGTELLESTPWGTHLVHYEYLDDWTTEQIRLDEQGQPELTAFVPPEVEGSVRQPRFAADGQRALVQASSFAAIELWSVDFAAGEPIAAELITSENGRDGSIDFSAITPDGNAALWSTIAGEFLDPGPLMLTPLEPELGPAVPLSNASLGYAVLLVDKLVYFTDEDLDGMSETWLLPLDDLLAAPTPGPVMPGGVWSSDHQQVYFRNGPDQLGLIEFDGLSFGATQVIAAPAVLAYDLARDDAIIYAAGDSFLDVDAFMMIDLSSGTPSAPMPVTSAADSIVGDNFSPSKQWFGYRAQDQAGYRLEVTDISDPIPGTPLLLLDQLATTSTTSLEFVDDQHVLLIGAKDSGPADLYVVDLASDPLMPILLTPSIPAEQGLEYTLALTPARDSVLFQLSEPGANVSEFLWRAGTGGLPAAEQLSVDAGWELGRIRTLPIAP